MKCKFVVGQHVVCIDALTQIAGKPNSPQPSMGEICKITEILPGPIKLSDPRLTATTASRIWLALHGFGYAYFCSRSFRPLQQRPTQTSIEVFRKLLTRTGVPA